MTSFIKLFYHETPDHCSAATSRWMKNSDVTYEKLDIYVKCQWLLSQSLLCHYFSLLYDDSPMLHSVHNNSSINLFKNYQNDLIYKVKQLRRENHTLTLFSTVSACEFLLGVSSNAPQVVKEELYALLSADFSHIVDPEKRELPDTLRPSFYTAYLHYTLAGYQNLNKKIDAGIFEEKDNKEFAECEVPVFNFYHNTICYSYVKFNSYKFDATVLNSPDNNQLYSSIFGFWLGLNTASTSMTALIGFLASQAIIFDKAIIPPNSMSWLWYKLYTAFFDWQDPIQNISFPVSSDNHDMTRWLTYFLVHHRKTHNVVFDDKSILAKVLSVDPKLSDLKDAQIVEYVSSSNLASISAEALNTFNESLYSKFPELFQKTPSTAVNEDTALSEAAPVEESPAIDDDAPVVDDPLVPEVAPEEDTSEDTHNTQSGIEIKPDFEFKVDVTTPETLDSYLFRVQVGQQIDAILADPPSNLDSNQLLLLKKLRVYWLYLLNVKTVYQIVHTMFNITLPVTQ